MATTTKLAIGIADVAAAPVVIVKGRIDPVIVSILAPCIEHVAAYLDVFATGLVRSSRIVQGRCTGLANAQQHGEQYRGQHDWISHVNHLS